MTGSWKTSTLSQLLLVASGFFLAATLLMVYRARTSLDDELKALAPMEAFVMSLLTMYAHSRGVNAGKNGNGKPEVPPPTLPVPPSA